MEMFYRQPITRALIELDDEGKYRRRVTRYEAVTPRNDDRARREVNDEVASNPSLRSSALQTWALICAS